MNDRTKQAVLIGSLAICLALLVVWLTWDRHRSEAGPQSSTIEPTSTPDEPAELMPKEKPAPPMAPAKVPVKPVAVALPVAEAEWEAQPEVEFSQDDLKNTGHGVLFDLGSYRARVGQEFEVAVRFEGPPLMLMILGLDFDPAVVEVEADSARPVGTVFRTGLECYADNTRGKLVLLQTGSPGMKNVNVGTGDVIAKFKMKGKVAGTTELRLTTKGIKFVNGKGEEERFGCRGGGILIEP